MTDATTWLPLTPAERRSLALHCIAEVYDGRQDINGNTIKVRDLLIGTADAVWSASSATGDAMFFPGQFESRFEPARRPEGNVFFAGEHLSYHHTWITGAADSALNAVRQMLEDPNLRPLIPPYSQRGPMSDGEEDPAALPVIIGAADGDDALPTVEYTFSPTPTMFDEYPPVLGKHDGQGKEMFPLDLGRQATLHIGAQITSLVGPFGV